MKRQMLLLAPLTTLLACAAEEPPPTWPSFGDDDDAVDDGLTGTAALRIAHGLPGVGAVDVWLDGYPEPLALGLQHGEALAVDVDASAVDLQLRASPSTAADPALLTVSLDLQRDAEHLLLVAAGEGGEGARGLLFDDSFPSGHVRLANATTDSASLALDLDADGALDVLEIPGGADSGDLDLLLSGGQLRLVLHDGETEDRLSAFTIPDLSGGDRLWLFALGDPRWHPRDARGLALLAVGEASAPGVVRQDPWLHVLHAMPGAGAVQLTVDGAARPALGFGELAEGIQRPPGSTTIDALGSAAAIQHSTALLAAGEHTLAVLAGAQAAPVGQQPQVLELADGFTLTDEAPRLRAVHAADSTADVDLGALQSGAVAAIPDFVGIGFGVSSFVGGTPQTPGLHSLAVAHSGQTTPLQSYPGVGLAEGDRAYLILTRTPLGGLQMLRVDAAPTGWAATALASD